MESVQRQAELLTDLLAGPLCSSILQTHPNDLGADLIDHLDIPQPTGPTPRSNAVCLSSWWNWAIQGEYQWKKIVEADGRLNYGPHENDPYTVPAPVLELLVNAKTNSLPRFPDVVALWNSKQASGMISSSGRIFKLKVSRNDYSSRAKHRTGMTPKKEHEVSRMTACIVKTLEEASHAIGTAVRHIVDIGAGQGYLSCSLSDLAYESSAPESSEMCSPDIHILALDSSVEQLEGAERRANARRHCRPKNNQSDNSRNSLTFRTVWLGDAPSHDRHPGHYSTTEAMGSSHQDLEAVIDDWLKGIPRPSNNRDVPQGQIPITLVALHACGSLTPSILRRALQLRRDASGRGWFVAAVVVVGCCYNLLESHDFPLSKTVLGHIEDHHPDFALTYGHLQLAAQVPTNWIRDKEAEARADLTIKKVLYRSLVTPALVYQESDDPRDGFDKTRRRLGKLNDKCYESFQTFLRHAGKKVGVDLSDTLKRVLRRDPRALDRTNIARRIEVLQALRCILGPPLESLIILDRIIWLWENISSQSLSSAMHLELINVFDQARDSGRNIAIVMRESRFMAPEC